MIIFHLSDEECRCRTKSAATHYPCTSILITTGDLRNYRVSWLDDGPEPERKPAFGVYGNHCVPGYMGRYRIQNLHNHIVSFRGLLWGGFQGCPRYRESSVTYTELQAENWSDKFPRIDVLLLHAPPESMLDDPTDAIHRGSPAIRRYVLRHAPAIVLAGHHYSDAAMIVNDSTTMFRTYGGRLIEIPGQKHSISVSTLRDSTIGTTIMIWLLLKSYSCLTIGKEIKKTQLALGP